MEKFTISYLKSLSKLELGTLGENLVLEKLKKLGYDAVNANTIKNNYKAIDLICTNPQNSQSVGIQVKTTFGSNVPIGMTIENSFRDILEKKIVGPWVFIHIDKQGEFRFFILSKEEMITLTHESNNWYVNEWKTTFRKNPIKLTSACGLCIKWLEGEGEKENSRHYAFKNPLNITSENCWDKIIEAVNQDSLYKTLDEFTGVTDIKDENEKFLKLDHQFLEIAKYIFYGGYFSVNDNRRIYPEDIEFYYHEEDENGLKDPVMYHTNDHEKKNIPYFPIGSLNFHISGVDVTFENEYKKYRASFLIRKYSVFDFDRNGCRITKKNETRSTYIYDDMLMNIPIFNGINIKWVDEQVNIENQKITKSCRTNVAAYVVNKDNKYIKDKDGYYIKEEISNETFKQLAENEKIKYFSYSGKKYKKCTRDWKYSK